MHGEPIRPRDHGQTLHPARVEDDGLNRAARRARVLERRPVDVSRAREMLPEDVTDPASEVVVEARRHMRDPILPIEHDVRVGSGVSQRVDGR